MGKGIWIGSCATVFFVLSTCGCGAFAQPSIPPISATGDQKARAVLPNYVNTPDSTFAWHLTQQFKSPQGTFLALSFQSQTWRSIPWKHQLFVFFPAGNSSQTGFPSLQMEFDLKKAHTALRQLAQTTGVPCAILCDIPNQPLFEGKEEEELLNYTFEQFLATKDTTWPLLLPMVKATVRAMDVLQAASQGHHLPLLYQFVVAGHSKRGHTAWLTAAVDRRVAGLIAQGFNTLHAARQIPHYLATYGALDQSALAAKQVIEQINSPTGQQLLAIVDAYTYRQQLTMPKLVILGTNDDYTPVDALNLYWSGLGGSKSILSLPNTGHVGANNDPRLYPTAYAFIERVAHGKPMPTVESTMHPTPQGSRLMISTTDSAVSARVWIATSPTLDFRDAQWEMKTVPLMSSTVAPPNKLNRRSYQVDLENRSTGNQAVIAEVEFYYVTRRFWLSTIPYVLRSH
ncbi:PhoPQ-activated protein PqaA family protein [Spirosoma sp. KNUC1025]|uniref:PhoPQ-activated protein PqaA family protein n=1 Tax=Spirosoma sp. KNUC1025 TaxID=2894082 RepID=UPI001E62A9D3|nr:PhoPQ-activated protein PqaA family protein [Spirosoma sp. KNUC1025]UFH57752.1 PhoPQ-activated pathogenicity-related family protein [Spirosoma sp. KNUC1025]